MFDGSGTQITDSITPMANGTLTGGGTLASGALTLSGTNQYVDLPNGLISSLTAVTVEAWVTWNGGGDWQRIFDFGDNEMAEGGQGTGATYLFLTPQANDGLATPALRAAFTVSGPGAANETQVDSVGPLPTGSPVHVAVVAGGGALTLYIDGEPSGSVTFSGQLSGINDINNWIGRSQFGADGEFNGTFREFRIYNAALSAAVMQTSFEEGENPAFLLN